MYLEQLQLIGFKSFAKKTVLEFRHASQKNIQDITAIVGKNGSGKSNISDSVRWVLGEQSIKSLRAKNSTDMIFTGKNSKMNLAEVSLTFNNEDKKAPIDYNEFTITRRLYRSGENEYFINKNKVKLNEILVLLAQANVGQKSYSIIGQGATDAILQSSPIERKKFFDEATGIKQYQIKRDNSLRKIEKSKSNLREAEIALTEIKPRLQSLTRQINKIKRREEIETKLYNLQKIYYRKIWNELKNKINNLNKNLRKKLDIGKTIENELASLRQKTAIMAHEKPNKNFQQIQELYYKLSEEKNRLIEEKASIQMKLTLIQRQASEKQNKIEVPQEIIVSSIKKIKENANKLLENLNKNVNNISLNEIRVLTDNLIKKIDNLSNLFKQNSTPQNKIPEIKILTQELENKEEKIAVIEKKINETIQKQKIFQEEESKGREKLFTFQEKIEKKQSELNSAYQPINDTKIELAKLETKKEALEEEIKNETTISLEKIIQSNSAEETTNVQFTDTDRIEYSEQINKLKRQLDLIGGIDPEITKEYPKIKARYEFLSSQSIDLKQSIKNLKKITAELDFKIKNKFKQNFLKINQEFDKYFKIFFPGGKAHLELEENIVEDNNNEIQKSYISGIDIKITIPDKKIKNVEVLSGGEKVLTSFALIAAIISINKPPFVLLDEADAALDEGNATKLGKILSELNTNTQFIIITHNRQTMESANILYGINMDSDGISHLISLKLEK